MWRRPAVGESAQDIGDDPADETRRALVDAIADIAGEGPDPAHVPAWNTPAPY